MSDPVEGYFSHQTELEQLRSKVAELEAENARLDHLHKLDHSLADQWFARMETAEAQLAKVREGLEKFRALPGIFRAIGLDAGANTIETIFQSLLTDKAGSGDSN